MTDSFPWTRERATGYWVALADNLGGREVHCPQCAS
jgi:hypothetical protein